MFPSKANRHHHCCVLQLFKLYVHQDIGILAMLNHAIPPSTICNQYASMNNRDGFIARTTFICMYKHGQVYERIEMHIIVNFIAVIQDLFIVFCRIYCFFPHCHNFSFSFSFLKNTFNYCCLNVKLSWITFIFKLL